MQLFFLFCIGNFLGNVNASSAHFEVEVPLKSFQGQTPNAASPVVHHAFKEMLVNVTGTETILTTKEVIQAMSEMDRYINQFSFHQPTPTERTVKIQFNGALINQLLSATKMPMLEDNKPLTLVWLVVERDKKPKWVSADSELELKQQIESAFARRGFPVVFPLLDLAETTVISEKDIWNGMVTPLAETANRYDAKAVLIGKLSGQPGDYQSHWTFLGEGESSHTWDIKETEQGTLFNKALEQLASQFIKGKKEQKTVAVQTENKANHAFQNMKLIISGINNMEQHAKIEGLLRNFSFVKEVEIVQISPEETIFKMRVTEGRDAVVKSMASIQFLAEDSTRLGLEGEDRSQALVYKMVEEL